MFRNSLRGILTLVCVLFATWIYAHAQGRYLHASQRLLTADDTKGLSKQELKIMRNEIFARYGYQFKSPDMKDHFAAQSWYRPLATDVSKRLTAIEKKNIEFIKSIEEQAPNQPSNKKASRFDGIRAPNGLLVADVEIHYASQERDPETGNAEPPRGVAVVTFSDRDRSWSTYRVGEEVYALSPSGIDYSSDDDIRSSLESLLQEEPLFTGNGETPTFDLRYGMWETREMAEWNGKVRALSDEYWGDFYLSYPVALPADGKPGRVENVIIEKVIHQEAENAVWFRDELGQDYYVGEGSPFPYTPPDESVNKYVYLGNAFALRATSNGKARWHVYPNSYGDTPVEAITLELEPSLEPTLIECEESNDQKGRCNYVLFCKSNVPSIIVDFETRAQYKLPPGTRAANAKERKQHNLDSDIRNIVLPNIGVVSIGRWGESECVNLFRKEGYDSELIDIEQFRVQ